MYGVTKVAGELLADYYASRFGVDVRGLRFPGLISHTAPPGGGTTDYAVTIFYEALRHGHYECFLRADTRLDMMYMPDAIRAVDRAHGGRPGALEAPQRVQHRRGQLHAGRARGRDPQAHPGVPHRVRRSTRSGSGSPTPGPKSLDDSAARAEWGWAPRYGLAEMVADMLEQLRRQAPRLRH